MERVEEEDFGQGTIGRVSFSELHLIKYLYRYLRRLFVTIIVFEECHDEYFDVESSYWWT